VGKKYSDISTWLNTIVTVLSLGISSGISYVYFKDHIFQVLTVVELFIISYLIIKLILISISDSPPFLNIKNKKVFNDFYSKEIRFVRQRKDQLNNGYLQLFGDEVERVQSDLFDYIQDTASATIRATDMTWRPDILLTRKKYLEINKAFIKSGGKIKRILILPDSNITEFDYFKSLLSVIKKNRECHVDIGLIPLSKLNKNEAQDFIIYDEFSVLVEGMQADSVYAYGTSTLYFRKSMYEEYDKIFQKLWDNTKPSPTEIAIKFEADMERASNSDAKFEYSNFLKQLSK